MWGSFEAFTWHLSTPHSGAPGRTISPLFPSLEQLKGERRAGKHALSSPSLSPHDSQSVSRGWGVQTRYQTHPQHPTVTMETRLWLCAWSLMRTLIQTLFSWTEVVETTDKSSVYPHAQQDRHSRRKPNSSCPLQGLGADLHPDASLRRALGYDFSLTWSFGTALLVEKKSPSNGVFSSFFKIGQRMFQGVSCCPSHLFKFCLLAS